ncbi:MAG: T9SS type A sorting domain-containing protein [Candidatus Cloacimonadota bacterium]|nr:T9SS type A sorting domain-containing protein [Candidatus Cloacimonadota bacterium]
MKKIVLLVCFVLMASFAFGQNLASNPGFENWTVNGASGPPDDWSLSGSSMTATQESATIHGGSYSTNITWTTTSTRYLQQSVVITAGTNYQFTFWVYDNDQYGRARVAIRWYDSGGSFVSGYYGGYSADSSEWQQLDSGIQEAPATAVSAHLEIRIYDVSWSGVETATVYVDDVSFTVNATSTIINSYAISSDALEVYYSADQTAVNPSDYTLSGTTAVTFTTATIDATDAKLVHLTGASPAMVGDATLDTITDSNNSTSFEFYAGITPVSCTNTNNPSGTINNTNFATFQVIVSANDGYNNVWVSDAAGEYNGVLIYDWDFYGEVSVGDEILFTANRDVYSGLTELKNPTLLNTISTGNTPYGPTLIDASGIEETIPEDTNPGEKWEGQFVEIQNFHVDSYTDYDYTCSVGSDVFHIGDNVDFHFGNFTLQIGATYQNIQGVVDWDNGSSHYRLNPRDQDDATLPVELSSFTASYSMTNGNEFVMLNWETASETDVLGFNIYRSEDDENMGFEPINLNLIPGNGTTTEPTDYSFEDITANIYLTHYYWLEVSNFGGSTDLHGPFCYAPATGGNPNPQDVPYTMLENCWPNPVNNSATINYQIKGDTDHQQATIQIFNVLGQVVKTVTGNDFKASFNVSDLSNGIYFYKLETGNYSAVKKFMVMK